jgi:hypothetical protein
MRDHEARSPFKLDLSSVVKRMKGLPIAVDAKIKISIPFFELTVKPDDRENKVAREIIIRLADRRVLNSSECCDNCIDEALGSLKEIRKVLVEKQVELSDKSDSALYILIDSIREAIRQFQTFEQRLNGKHKVEGRRYAERESYFAARELLRGHIYRTLLQIAKVGDFDIRRSEPQMRYDEVWDVSVYKTVEVGGTLHFLRLPSSSSEG